MQSLFILVLSFKTASTHLAYNAEETPQRHPFHWFAWVWEFSLGIFHLSVWYACVYTSDSM